MVIVISTSIVAVILAYFSGDRKYRNLKLLKIAFILVTMLQVIHYDYGSDYMQYYNQHFFYNGTIRDYIELGRRGYGAYRSIGWAVINGLFPGKTGFFFIVGLISVIENCIYYQFIVQNVNRRDRWKAFSIYVFTTTLYVVNFSALRQGFAVALGVLAMMMVGKKKPVPALAIIAIAFLFHTSVIVLFPFVLLSMIPLESGKKYAVCIAVVSLAFFVSNVITGDMFSRVIQSIPILANQFGVYFGEEASKSDSSLGIGFLLRLVMFITLLYYIYFKYNKLSYKLRLFVLLCCVDLCIIPFQVTISGMISRIEYYFIPFQMVSVPVVYKRIKNKMIRIGITTIFTFLLLYAYYNFFFVTQWSASSYAQFHTIFDVMFK